MSQPILKRIVVDGCHIPRKRRQLAHAGRLLDKQAADRRDGVGWTVAQDLLEDQSELLLQGVLGQVSDQRGWRHGHTSL